jgi:DNA damage-binding protein 1
LPRTLLLHKEDLRAHIYKTRLVVGLSDGTVETFLFENEKELKERVSFKLGELPVSLHQCEIKDRHTVLAVGSRALLIYWGKTRLKKSPVNVKVNCVHEFGSGIWLTLNKSTLQQLATWISLNGANV